MGVSTISVLAILALLGFGVSLAYISGKLFNSGGWVDLWVLHSKNDRKLLRFLDGAEYEYEDHHFRNPAKPDIIIQYAHQADKVLIRKKDDDDDRGIVLTAYTWPQTVIAFDILKHKVGAARMLRLKQTRKEISEQLSKVIL